MSGKDPNEHLTFREKYAREKDDVSVEGFFSFWNSYLRLPFYGILLMVLSVLFFRFSFLLVDMLKTFTLHPSSSLLNEIAIVFRIIFIIGGLMFIRGVYNILNLAE